MGRNHSKLINKLKQLRKSCGLTQQELSIKAEVSRKSINAIENGVYVPSTVLALKISKNHKIIGPRQGEKLQEILITEEEKSISKEKENMWIIQNYS